MSDAEAILAARHLTTVLGGNRGFLRGRQPRVAAVDDVSISVRNGESLGIVGESGSGKTTLARTLTGVQRETSGEIVLGGKRVDGIAPGQARHVRSAIQYLHQDAAGSLDPWWSVGRTIAEALAVHGVPRPFEKRIDQMLEAVGLDGAIKRQYPHQLSGGQLRRVALARLLVLAPRILILDEPTSGLDLSIQAAVLNLVAAIRRAFGLTVIFVSHDMAVVRLMCDRVAVMYRGRIVEQAPAPELFATPRHPYTRALIAATPHLGARRAGPGLAADPPAAEQDVVGCAFHPRCPHAIDICRTQRPQAEPAGSDGQVACHRWRELARPAVLDAGPAVR